MKKNNLFRYSIVAALAGFIFGFDTVVISGANQPIKDLWHTSTNLNTAILQCPICGKTFKTKQGLTQHNTIIANIISFVGTFIDSPSHLLMNLKKPWFF